MSTGFLDGMLAEERARALRDEAALARLAAVARRASAEERRARRHGWRRVAGGPSRGGTAV
jgi:hypothetical protein